MTTGNVIILLLVWRVVRCGGTASWKMRINSLGGGSVWPCCSASPSFRLLNPPRLPLDLRPPSVVSLLYLPCECVLSVLFDYLRSGLCSLVDLILIRDRSSRRGYVRVVKAQKGGTVKGGYLPRSISGAPSLALLSAPGKADTLIVECPDSMLEQGSYCPLQVVVSCWLSGM